MSIFAKTDGAPACLWRDKQARHVPSVAAALRNPPAKVRGYQVKKSNAGILWWVSGIGRTELLCRLELMLGCSFMYVMNTS
jgi:hypothetical protein